MLFQQEVTLALSESLSFWNSSKISLTAGQKERLWPWSDRSQQTAPMAVQNGASQEEVIGSIPTLRPRFLHSQKWVSRCQTSAPIARSTLRTPLQPFRPPKIQYLFGLVLPWFGTVLQQPQAAGMPIRTGLSGGIWSHTGASLTGPSDHGRWIQRQVKQDTEISCGIQKSIKIAFQHKLWWIRTCFFRCNKWIPTMQIFNVGSMKKEIYNRSGGQKKIHGEM